MPTDAFLWMLSNGVALWWTMLSLTLLLGVAAGVLRARRGAAREAVARRGLLGTPIAPGAELHDGEAFTIAGRLEAESGAATAVMDARDRVGVAEACTTTAVMDAGYRAHVRGSATVREKLAQVRAGRLVIVAGARRVEIAGPVEIVLGSREVGRVRRLGQVPEALRAGFDPWQAFLGKLAIDVRSLAPGDEVWAAGVARCEADPDLGTYRDRPMRWCLTPSPREEARSHVLLAFARTPRPRAAPLVAWCAVHALAAGLLLAGGTWAFGDRMLARLAGLCRGDAQVEPMTLATDEVIETATAAAISPAQGGRVMTGLQERLELRGPEDPSDLELLAALYENGGQCEQAAALWIEHGQLERGAARAEACGVPAMAARAWYSAADFARASRAWERESAAPTWRDPTEVGTVSARDRLRFGVRVHLLAGRPEMAATEARKLAQAIWGPWPSKDRSYTDARAGRAHCLADALDARRGDRAALARLAGKHAEQARRACVILLADVLAGAERRALIDAQPALSPERDDVPARWLGLLAAEVDPELREAPALGGLDDPGALAARPATALREALPALDRALAETIRGARPPMLRGRAHVSLAASAFAAVAGEGEVSRRFAAAAREATPRAPRLDELDAAFAYLEGDEARFADRVRHARAAGPVAPFLEAAAFGRETGDFWQAILSADLFWIHAYQSPEIERALLGFVGDGRRLGNLARDIEEDRPGHHGIHRELWRALRLMAPSIHERRDNLLRWIHSGRRRIDGGCDALCQLIASRDLALAVAALGDDALAATLRARGEAFHRALLRRDIAVPLAVLEAL